MNCCMYTNRACIAYIFNCSIDSPSPSESSDLSTVPIVQCNAPLIAPKPLPYHSPTFLQFELLPDIDEDLSHPPYTQRGGTASKRKRDSFDDTDRSSQKRPAWPQRTQQSARHRVISRYQFHQSPRHPYYYAENSPSGKPHWHNSMLPITHTRLG